ncbi:hypothetical protein FOZ76_23755 [Verticiella sediminum]|uniref:Uncharacterized protein n=1 Tax=Verticiella sediminum TaxID=1247510 RepID=A0A556A918_9BURK|nr:hypothetical protein [Verticiella sediminum]TSH89375.1 hypothetical protein FOZ76_23755 [Verticiella sediminum]
MKAEFTVNFGNGRVLELAAPYDKGNPQAPTTAHHWLSDAYEALGCEPVRPSGKVLLLDRILAIAIAKGYDGLRADPEFAAAFVRHAAQAVGQPRVVVDVPGLTVGY